MGIFCEVCAFNSWINKEIYFLLKMSFTCLSMNTSYNSLVDITLGKFFFFSPFINFLSPVQSLAPR
jgi:hypothetical protein